MNDDATQLDSRARDTTALGATMAAPSSDARTFTPPVTATRTTVLPRIATDGPRVTLSLEPRRRYEPSKVLGKGGMG